MDITFSLQTYFDGLHSLQFCVVFNLYQFIYKSVFWYFSKEIFKRCGPYMYTWQKLDCVSPFSGLCFPRSYKCSAFPTYMSCLAQWVFDFITPDQHEESQTQSMERFLRIQLIIHRMNCTPKLVTISLVFFLLYQAPLSFMRISSYFSRECGLKTGTQLIMPHLWNQVCLESQNFLNLRKVMLLIYQQSTIMEQVQQGLGSFLN